ncbi:hypothetical protein K490DRAFT_64115 [Saccharata proteae CBS 121410]|uniref:Uncharacterized protein n=1 Tax=Saccharata proteae CBS 121410 TaxID=1314787 RepID=A0A6A5YBM1_9PEZI|nr:hypothetical protein K490DRAFT_64115 [Saccharata proteae CBS 121410]
MSPLLCQDQEPLDGHEEYESSTIHKAGPCSHINASDSTPLEGHAGIIKPIAICNECKALQEAKKELWVAYQAIRSQWGHTSSRMKRAKRKALQREWHTKRANLANCQIQVEEKGQGQSATKNSGRARRNTKVKINPHQRHKPEHLYKSSKKTRGQKYPRPRPTRQTRKKAQTSAQERDDDEGQKSLDEQWHETSRPWTNSDFDYSMGRAFLQLVGCLEDQHKRAKGRSWWGVAGIRRVDSVLKGKHNDVNPEPDYRHSPPGTYRPASTFDTSKLSISDDPYSYYDETRGGFCITGARQSELNGAIHVTDDEIII